MNTTQQLIPFKYNPEAFTTKPKEGPIACKLIFPQKSNNTCLKYIASGSELKDITEMYQGCYNRQYDRKISSIFHWHEGATACTCTMENLLCKTR